MTDTLASAPATRHPAWIATAIAALMCLGILGLNFESDFVVKSTSLAHKQQLHAAAMNHTVIVATNHTVYVDRVIEKVVLKKTLVNAVDHNTAYVSHNYDNTTVHIVYSTSCDQPNRHFLSAALQVSASKVGQRGPITEIISGCSDEEVQRFASEPSFYHDYHRHFTPSYSPHPKSGITDDYSPYNKPFALRHLLHTPPSSSNPAAVKGNMPVALMDADFIFFQPLRVNTGADLSSFYHGEQRQGEEIQDVVADGHALAQDWTSYYGAGWFNPDNEDKKAAVCAGKPCMDVTSDDGREYYAGGGPPYILTKNDWLKMIDSYGDFVIAGRKLSKNWMVEMYAYGLAAGNHHIKHTLVTHLGPTWPQSEVHSWTFLDDDTPNPCDVASLDVVLPRHPPISVHYCQKYGYFDKEDAGFHFYKYHIPYDILECDAMLLQLPPPWQWTDIPSLGLEGIDLVAKRHEVWTECTLAKILNQVFLTAKEKLCPLGFNTHQGLPMSEPHQRDSALPGGAPKEY
ncbi:hypothetical protein DYB30_005787 [Aphanomyces astaci]|uniref:Uncharacterized protein n=3 Tax=Aphanomyces astaci TaxID=112090 RepID=A0A397CGC2_APHAT|nr:hypothetical protein DYB30_005787 [Aphanomyces astaci]